MVKSYADRLESVTRSGLRYLAILVQHALACQEHGLPSRQVAEDVS